MLMMIINVSRRKRKKKDGEWKKDGKKEIHRREKHENERQNENEKFPPH